VSSGTHASGPEIGFNARVTPEQIALVTSTLQGIDVEALAADFYARAFAADPRLSAMFTTQPAIQESRFAKELAVIVSSIQQFDEFRAETVALGRRHRGYGVRAAHYRLMGDALLAALEAALADEWTPEAAEAWRMAYNLTAESMMAGAAQRP
jgi:hemoglobin-like flavoprotein